MIELSHIKKIVVLSCLLSLIGCTSLEQYRTQYALCISTEPETSCQESAIQQYKNENDLDQSYFLGFVEFDDLGQLWDREQMHTVIDQIGADTANKDVLMVVFVHGWKHSAKPNDSNIATFRQTLKRLSRMESEASKQTGREPRKIAGIYLGWRGLSVTVPGIKELSFWDRKEVAHTVGLGGVTEVLSRLDLIKKTKHEIDKKDGKESHTRLVVVGHSFGGAVVFSAVSKLLEQGSVQTQGSNAVVGDAIGFSDLVVLINPAFEAARYAALSDMANERATYFSTQLPALAILTSEADDATRRAFPGGRFFSTFFDKHRDIERFNPVTKEKELIKQSKADLKAVGHFDSYKTHDLRANEMLRYDNQVFNLQEELVAFSSIASAWEQDEPGSKIQFPGSLLTRTNNTAGRNPYLNIRVDKELIKDHNDINDPRVESFVRQLILISTQSEDMNIREKRRELAIKNK